jgi:F-type H+-transporting ATPase subunit a
MNIYTEIALGGQVFTLHPTAMNGFLLAIILSILMFLLGRRIKKADPAKASKGSVLLMEVFVSGVEGLETSTMGGHNLGFAPFIGTLCLYLATANMLGMIGFVSPTADYNVTLGLALFTICMMYGQGFKSLGVMGTIKEALLGDIPFLLPLNIINEISKPLSLSIRLFGNMMSGAIILSLIYQALGWFAPLLTPLLHAYFDVFSGVIQTLIFIMLTMIWTGGFSPEPEPELEAN